MPGWRRRFPRKGLRFSVALPYVPSYKLGAGHMFLILGVVAKRIVPFWALAGVTTVQSSLVPLRRVSCAALVWNKPGLTDEDHSQQTHAPRTLDTPRLSSPRRHRDTELIRSNFG